MSIKSAFLALGFMALAFACHSKKGSTVLSYLMPISSDVTLVGEHKKAIAARTDAVNFFILTTKNPDLFATQESIMKALKVTKGEYIFKTVLPGKYKVALKAGEYLITGWYTRYQSEGNNEQNTFMEYLVKIEGGKVFESTLSTVFTPAEQSEFVEVSSHRYIFNDGVVGQKIDLENFNYSVKNNEVTVEFPAYIDGRTF